MRILLVGGTRFVGRAMAEAAVRAGCDVTVLHRGTTSPRSLTGVRHLFADRDADLSVLTGEEYDATIDACAYFPRQVETLAAALGGRGGHHVLVSTVSVYADAESPGLTEESALVEPPSADVEDVTNDTYGGLKVLCERSAVTAYGDDGLTVVRPTYVVGPEDYTYRFPYWVARIAAGGDVLAPGPARSPVQVVDARDMGEWTVALAANRTAGTYNAIGTPLPFGFGDLLDATRLAVAPADTSLTWTDAAWLTEQGVTAQQLPLWSEGSDEWVLAGDNARALAAGLRPRPLGDTVTDTLDWLRSESPAPLPRLLSREREATLLAAWKAASSQYSV